MNNFMSQDEERLRKYRQYKGWRTIQDYMNLADEHDIKRYYDNVKKFSLLREYKRNGYPVNIIFKNDQLDALTCGDIYRRVRSKADQIHTIISASEDAIELTSNNTSQLDKYLEKPDYGLLFPWGMYNEYFMGMREGKILFEGFLSNEGKTRKLVYLAAYVALIQNQNFLLMSNEMDERDLRSCLITTVLNNPIFQKEHHVELKKPEREIVLGLYRDKNGEIIRRETDEKGQFHESNEDFIKRVQENSEEYWQVRKVTEWIDDENRKGKVYFQDVSDDYSIERIELELRKASITQEMKYYGYDTLKGYKTDDWSQIKQFATKLKEITKDLNMSGYTVFQLTDDTVFTDIFSLSSNNIANAKQIKHIADILNIGKRISRDDYHKYRMVLSNDAWGEPVTEDLDLNKNYFAIKPDKNRAGEKDKIMLFEFDLNYNIWDNIGYIIKK